MADSLPRTIPELLRSNVESKPDEAALGLIRDGELSWCTWNTLDELIRRGARVLRHNGVQAGDQVAQWAQNGVDWIIKDLATMLLGATHVPLHATLSEARATELLELADAKVVVRSHPGSPQIKNAKAKDVVFTPQSGLALDLPPISYSELESVGVTGDDLATLLFTSGTTGQPRGVMLTHENLVSNAIAVTEAVGSSADETRLCFLPLSHIYARTCDLYSWLYRGSKLVLAESRDTIVRDCQLAKPTVINGVPYFYQKIAQQVGDAPPGTLQQLFGGKLKYCFCGGAALAPEVAQVFEKQGLPILAGYGLTESSPVISATAFGDYRRGTVGPPLPNVEAQISSDGEILVRGPNVMQGYWNDQTATDETIVDGWLHTGDLGEFDEAGHLRIVGRQKEIIVLSTGKNVSPARVEGIISGSRLVEHVCVVGDGRKCLGALIVPNPDTLRVEIRARKLWVWSKKRAVTHPKVRDLFRAEIDRLLASASAEEQVGCFALLPRNFSIEAGEFTAKLSLRRQTIARHFGREIDRMYAG